MMCGMYGVCEVCVCGVCGMCEVCGVVCVQPLTLSNWQMTRSITPFSSSPSSMSSSEFGSRSASPTCTSLAPPSVSSSWSSTEQNSGRLWTMQQSHTTLAGRRPSAGFCYNQSYNSESGLKLCELRNFAFFCIYIFADAHLTI